MWLLYLIAALPILAWAIVFYMDRKVTWWEWLGGSVVGFIVAGIFHLITVFGMTADTQTLSGEITTATHYPRWVEEYEETHSETTTDSHGHSHTRYWTTTEHRTHSEHWGCEDNLGRSLDITESFFEQIRQNFNSLDTETPYKSGFYSGDKHTYVSHNRTGYLYPVTALRTFENRIKAAPSVFSFVKVPTNVAVFAYPANQDWLASNRLLGTAGASIDLFEWDRMNARLGPSKRVNVIAIGFTGLDSSIGDWQQAAYIGGKKNDLVITYGGSDPLHPQWVKVFGWTEAELVKRNLETIILRNPFDTSILPLLEKEIRQNYQLKDWHKFDYITVEPPGWSYLILLLVMAVAQGGLMFLVNSDSFRDQFGDFER